ncbi:hypothetical protein K438DRAFT_337865 [Mycena galopus ATCC 62051]|nr:hypothetical protein K438DRAFT_337865 [Mycena galopus ATCC 62051]
MSTTRCNPKPSRRNKRKDERRKNTQRRTPAPSPQPSRSTTPVPSNSAPRGVDRGADLLKGGDTAKADKSDTLQSKSVGPTYNINLAVHGGAGGSGGQGGKHGGHGGPGQGPKISFPNSNVTLTDPHATEIQFIEKELANHVTTQHKFTDQSKSLCAAGTRVKIQADILKWLSPQPGTNEHIFWITGIAGSGKSTLSATLVDNLRKKGTPVAAQFFISRNIPETIDPGKIIPTIAQQLAKFSPDAAHIIQDKLKNGFPSSQKEQVDTLLLAPIQELSKSRDAVIIVIDALDELQNAAKSVLEILSPIAPRGCNLSENIRFLITSRPEHWADISRSQTLELTAFKQRPLETESSVHEVHNFIIARMKQITRWKDWPSDEEVQKLSDKANGLFHYAATALHWIEEQIHSRGTAARKQVFEKFTQMGIGQLEDLYRLILTSFENIDGPALDADWRVSQLRGFQHVIGTILVLNEPFTIQQIIALLADIPEDDFDVTHFLQQYRSVLIPGTTTSFEEATPQMHKSFRDYIMDGHAPAEFRVLTGHAHFVTARSCLEVIVNAGGQSDVVLKYSVQHWYGHLRKAVERSETLEEGRMWNLFGQMVEKAVVNVWARTDLMNLFVDVATAGWGLLKQPANKDKMQGISNILIKAKVCGGPPMNGNSVPSILIEIPLVPRKCVLFPHHPCLSCSLFLAFSSLGSACFSPIAHVCFAHFFSPSRL